jgi:hypothetical protein
MRSPSAQPPVKRGASLAFSAWLWVSPSPSSGFAKTDRLSEDRRQIGGNNQLFRVNLYQKYQVK